MNQDRNKYLEDERIIATIFDAAGSVITGSTSVLLTIISSSASIYDFDDKTFKTSGWTTSSQPMTELDSTSAAGTYYHDFDASALGIFGSQRNYLIRATHSTASNSPLEGYLKLGGWIDSVGLVGSGGGGGGKGITSEQAQEIAERVWRVILKGKDTASDILLRKSEFDATKDYVLMTSDPELQNLLNEIKKIDFPDNSDKIISAINKLKPIDFNPVLERVIKKISSIDSLLNQGKKDMVTAIECQEKYDDSEMKVEMKEMMDECKTMISMMGDDLSEKITARKKISVIVREGDKIEDDFKDEVGKITNHLEKQEESNIQNIKKILLKMTELKFDTSNESVSDFEYIKDQLALVLDHLEEKNA